MMLLLTNKKNAVMAWLVVTGIIACIQPVFANDQARFLDFVDVLTNSSDYRDVNDPVDTDESLSLLPVFIFDQPIKKQLAESGRRDAKSLSEGELTNDTFIKNNELTLTRARNQVSNYLLRFKYIRPEQTDNATTLDTMHNETHSLLNGEQVDTNT